MSGLRLRNYADVCFEELLDYARASRSLSSNAEEFLDDIEAKHDRWGEDMYFSEAQLDYLMSLAHRGGWRSAAEREEEEANPSPLFPPLRRVRA
jgi:hypothetical protein